MPMRLHAAKAKAAHENISLGKVVSDLILQGLRQGSGNDGKRRTSAVFRSPGGLHTAAEAEAALDDE